jgi:hypothetical protein
VLYSKGKNHRPGKLRKRNKYRKKKLRIENERKKNVPTGRRHFSVLRNFKTAFGTHTNSYVIGIGVLSPG